LHEDNKKSGAETWEDLPHKSISAPALEAQIGKLLDCFFIRRISLLQTLELDAKIRRKNPYLIRAIGIASADEIVKELLDAHISSSNETLFGNEFFEPLAKWVAEQAFSDQPGTAVTLSDGEGVDIRISRPNENQVIAVKSGINVFNAQSRARQATDFAAVRSRLAREKKSFLEIVGYSYGRKDAKPGGKFTEMAGQVFWSHLTGEDDFYLRIVEMMKNKPLEHRPMFLVEYDKAKNRFTKDFLDKYALEDGSIDWSKLTSLISSVRVKIPKPPKASSAKKSTPSKKAYAVAFLPQAESRE
jgi:hypothetical protein